jgi:hypothetical protein
MLNMPRRCPHNTNLMSWDASLHIQNNIADKYPPLVLAVLSTRHPELLNQLGDDTTSGKAVLVEDLRLAQDELLHKIIDDRVKMAAKLGCRRCTGVVVDLETADMYCGLNVPKDVRESNQRIEQSQQMPQQPGSTP